MIEAPSGRVELVCAQLDIAWGFFEQVVELWLSDEVAGWEPFPGCWTVRPRAGDEAVWDADWIVPEPAGSFGTAAWHLWHFGYFVELALDGVFGSASLRREDVTWPGSVGGAVEWVRGSFVALRGRIGGMAESDLDRVGAVNPMPALDSNPWASRSLGWVLSWVAFEVTSMVRALGMMRNLYELAHRGS